jgi:hypothetical protein
MEITINFIQELDVLLDIKGSCGDSSEGLVYLIFEDVDIASRWTFDGISFATDRTIENLPAGEYLIQLLVEEECLYEYSFEIPTFSLPQISINFEQPCNDDEAGKIHVSTAESIGILKLNDEIYEVNQWIDNIVPGEYQVEFHDENGCKVYELIDLSVRSPLIVSFNHVDNECGQESVILRPEVMSFAGSLRISWQDGSENLVYRADRSGTYTVKIEEDFAEVEHTWMFISSRIVALNFLRFLMSLPREVPHLTTASMPCHPSMQKYWIFP